MSAGSGAVSALGGAVWTIPAPVATFVGRDEELTRMRSELARPDGGSVVVFGLPGVGKSQVAAAYAAAWRDDFDVGWWVPAAGGRVAVVASLAALAGWLRLGDEDAQVAAERAVVALTARRRWLLVFDDVSYEADLAGLVPSGGQVVIASRGPLLGLLRTRVEIAPFNPSEATEFLCHRSGDVDRVAASALACELSGLPLALEQVGAYCAATGVTLVGYLERYRLDRRRLLAAAAPVGRLAVEVTLTMAVTQAGRKSHAARQLLRLLAFFAPNTGVPREVIMAGRFLPRPLATVVRDAVELDAAVALLRRMSLIACEGGQLRMHQVVQDVIREQIASVGRVRRWWRAAVAMVPIVGGDWSAGWQAGQWARLSVAVVGAALPNDPGDPAGWGRWATLLPHALAVVDHGWAYGDGPSLAASGLADRLGAYAYRRGDYGAAREQFARITAVRRKVLGGSHPDTLTSMNRLAAVLRRLGDVMSARHLHEHVLERRRRVLGEVHPDTLTSMDNLALVLARLGELSAARELHENELSACRRMLGDSHPDTLTSMNNLANVLRRLGELTTARELHEQVLAQRRRVLGEMHPDTLQSMNNLALVWHSIGMLATAREMQEKTLLTCRVVLGETHPHTLTLMNNLALVIADLGDVGTAAELHKQVLTMRRRVLGATHPDTLQSSRTLTAVGELSPSRIEATAWEGDKLEHYTIWANPAFEDGSGH